MLAAAAMGYRGSWFCLLMMLTVTKVFRQGVGIFACGKNSRGTFSWAESTPQNFLHHWQRCLHPPYAADGAPLRRYRF